MLRIPTGPNEHIFWTAMTIVCIPLAFALPIVVGLGAVVNSDWFARRRGLEI